MTPAANAAPVAAARAAGALPIVFLGPSMPLDEARALLEADYRPPVRRGDLDQVAAGTVVAIIDGVFEEHLAISPAEIRAALARGVRVAGGSSMGALRAAEVPGMTGIGRICEWYRSGRIDRDEEVALVFDPRSGAPLSVPLVNIRHALERLAGPGTIDPAAADAILAAARRLSFKDRTYRAILAEAGLGERGDAAELSAMLEAHDLKRSDAQAVLEWVDRLPKADAPQCVAAEPSSASSEAMARPPGTALVWESGDMLGHAALREFLLLTGALDRLLRGQAEGVGSASAADPGAVQAVLVETARRWGWLSAEETLVSLADLGISADQLDAACAREAGRRGAAERALAAQGGPVADGWLETLLLDGLALKRAILQIGSLRYFADRAGDAPPTDAERSAARQVWARVNGVAGFHEVARRWRALGLDRGKEHAAVDLLARARRAAAPLAGRMRGGCAQAPPPACDGTPGFPLVPCPKAEGDWRFAWPVSRAEETARALAARIGITRIGMIGELGEFIGGDVHIAQAARPGGAWSSSYGSGKSRTAAGAVVGSVIEEVEKWAQERFAPPPSLHASYAKLRGEGRCIDPATLDLPYDTCWRPDLELDWLEVDDLLGGGRMLIPLDPLRIARGKHDICFSARGARKHLATNGLGAGFAREEACLHGLCEQVERHAQRLAELFLSNPGGIGPHPYRLVRPEALGDRVGALAEALARNAEGVRLLDVTSEIAIPTFMATLVRNRQRAEGFGTHPNPGVAAEMALLEAAQTVSSQVAGGREDLSIRARSLGRHERPRPLDAADSWFWLDGDAVLADGPRCPGFVSRDVRDDLVWSLGRVRAAGFEQAIAVDLTPPDAAPAHVVRMIVPGIESNNPFHTGDRARLVLAREFLPRWR